MSKYNYRLVIPVGQLALDPTKLKRQKLADDLKAGRPLQLSSSGNVTGQEQTKLVTQQGKLALDPTKLKRQKLADDLKAGRPLQLSSSGNVTGQEQTKLVTQQGKLASQWYEYDTELFKDEKDAMYNNFPQFQLQRIDDSNS